MGEPSTATAWMRAGMRRVDWIRLLVGEREVQAEAVGVAFRLPRTCRIPVALAAALIAAGTPYVTRTLTPPAPA
jgi:hypothetical protein